MIQNFKENSNMNFISQLELYLYDKVLRISIFQFLIISSHGAIES